MNKNPLEKEVKFYINDLKALEDRLISLGALLIQPRTREMNFRYDTPQHSLAIASSALRIRHDLRNTITFKGPPLDSCDLRVRREIEVEVDDLETARDLLEALGYVEVVRYEKLRTLYSINHLEVSLDELPYGRFTEIEGEDDSAIRATAASLALAWERYIPSSYLGLFELLRQKKNLPVNNLTFEEFKGLPVSPEDLGVKPADVPRFV